MIRVPPILFGEGEFFVREFSIKLTPLAIYIFRHNYTFLYLITRST